MSALVAAVLLEAPALLDLNVLAPWTSYVPSAWLLLA